MDYRFWFAVCLLVSSASVADELRPAYLQLSESAEDVIEVYWKVPARGGRQRLSLGVKFGEAVDPLSAPREWFLNNVHVRQWQIRHSGGLAGLVITVDGLQRTNTEVLARYEYSNGSTSTHRFTPDANSTVVPAQPGWLETLITYFVLGIEHILLGIDHLLFVFALLLLVQGTRKLVWTITAFTIAHSITLILSSLGLVHLPIPPVEACIALSIVFVAVEVIRGQGGAMSFSQSAPWLVAFVFGLLHGLGFASALGEIGLPENALLGALLIFNLGVEAGQLLFVAVFLLLAWLLKQLHLPMPKIATGLAAYSVGGLAAFWVVERVAGFWI